MTYKIIGAKACIVNMRIPFLLNFSYADFKQFCKDCINFISFDEQHSPKN